MYQGVGCPYCIRFCYWFMYLLIDLSFFNRRVSFDFQKNEAAVAMRSETEWLVTFFEYWLGQYTDHAVNSVRMAISGKTDTLTSRRSCIILWHWFGTGFHGDLRICIVRSEIIVKANFVRTFYPVLCGGSGTGFQGIRDVREDGLVQILPSNALRSLISIYVYSLHSLHPFRRMYFLYRYYSYVCD